MSLKLVHETTAIFTLDGRRRLVRYLLGHPEAESACVPDVSVNVREMEASGIEVLVSTAAEGRRRTHDFRPAKALPAVKEPKADWLKAMAGKLASEQGRALYKLRRQTVEPVLGVIKAVLGFAGFSLRGLDTCTMSSISGSRRSGAAARSAATLSSCGMPMTSWRASSTSGTRSAF